MPITDLFLDISRIEPTLEEMAFASREGKREANEILAYLHHVAEKGFVETNEEYVIKPHEHADGIWIQEWILQSEGKTWHEKYSIYFAPEPHPKGGQLAVLLQLSPKSTERAKAFAACRKYLKEKKMKKSGQ